MKTKILTIFLAVTLLLSVNVFGAEAGSAEDPLVTKSYVDDRIEEILNFFFNQSYDSYGLTNEDFDNIVSQVITRLYDNQMGAINASIYRPISVNAGQMLVGLEGTEIIMRTGKGVVYTTTENGIVDVTGGEDLINGQAIPLNHMLITPRSDGRSIICLSDCWFMIKGSYNITAVNF